MGYGSVNIGATPTLIVTDNAKRLSIILINGGSDRVHFGQDASITTACPYIIPDGSFVEDSGGTKMYCGPFYGITTGGTATLYYWERER